MAQAKYSVMIPKVDNLGNPLTDLAAAAHHELFYGPLKVEGSYVDPDKRGHWRDEEPEPHDILVVVAEDEPMMDGQIKQLAIHIAEVANQWGIFVMKEGKSGVNSWVVNNPMYREGEPAEEVALQQPEPTLMPPVPPDAAPPQESAPKPGL
jgi:hypothetical protein